MSDSGSKWVARKAPSVGAAGSEPMVKRLSVTGISRVAKTPAEKQSPEKAKVEPTATQAEPALAAKVKSTDSPVVRAIRPKVIRTIARSSDAESILQATQPDPVARARRATVNIGAVAPDWLKTQAPGLDSAQAKAGGALGPPTGLSPEVIARRKANRRSLVVNKGDLIVARAVPSAEPKAEAKAKVVPKVVVHKARESRVETVCVDISAGPAKSGALSPEAVVAAAVAATKASTNSAAAGATDATNCTPTDSAPAPAKEKEQEASTAPAPKEENAAPEAAAGKEKEDKEKAKDEKEKEAAGGAEAAAGDEEGDKSKLSRISSKKKLSWIVHGLQKAKRNSSTTIHIGHDQADQKDKDKEAAAAAAAAAAPAPAAAAAPGQTDKELAKDTAKETAKETKAATKAAAKEAKAAAKEAKEAPQSDGSAKSSPAASPQVSPALSATSSVASSPAVPTLAMPGGEDAAKKASDGEDPLAKVKAAHTGKTREDKRKEILLEVVDTEQGYFSDLGVLMKVFLEPIRQQELLTKQQISSVFANLEAIYPVNEGMLAALRDLQAGASDTSIGEIFVERSVLFKLYAVYCSNQPNIRDRILALKEEKPEFAEFLKKQFRRPECRKLDLEAFLIKPLQRLCKYPLLLKELLKNTGSDHPEFEVLHQARTEISEIVTKVNERVRQVENLNKLIAIQNEIETDSDMDIVMHNRTFIHEGPMTINKRPYYCYLFSDAFLMCRIKKKKDEDVREASRLVALTMLSVADLDDTEELKNRMEIAEVGHKIMVAQAGSRIKKKQWLKHLRAAISAVEVNEADKQRALSTLRRLSVDNASTGGAAKPGPTPRGSSTARGATPKLGDGAAKSGSRIALKDSVKKLTENWEQRAKEPEKGTASPVMIDPRIKKMSTADKERRIVELERTLEAFKVRCIEMKSLLKEEKLQRAAAEKRAAHLQEVLATATDPQQALETAPEEKLPEARGRSKVFVATSANERLDTLNSMVDKITEENFRLRQKLKAAKTYVASLEERLRDVPIEQYQPDGEEEEGE